MELYTVDKNTLRARERKIERSREVNWTEAWEKYKDEIIEEGIPVEEMINANYTVYHPLKVSQDELWYVILDEDYVFAFFAEVVFNKLGKDEDYFDRLLQGAKEQRKQQARQELEQHIKDLALVRYNALDEGDTTTLEEIENGLREFFGLVESSKKKSSTSKSKQSSS